MNYSSSYKHPADCVYIYDKLIDITELALPLTVKDTLYNLSFYCHKIHKKSTKYVYYEVL